MGIWRGGDGVCPGLVIQGSLIVLPAFVGAGIALFWLGAAALWTVRHLTRGKRVGLKELETLGA